MKVAICQSCQEEKEIIAKGRCWVCYQRKRRKRYVPPPPRQEPCSLCGKTKTVAVRPNGRPVCPACYQREIRPKELCFLCGKVKEVTARQNGQAICPACRYRQRQAKMAKSPA